MNTNAFNRLPQSIGFGCTILSIPSLQEMGIPLSGLGIVESSETLGQYLPNPETCWINRGDLLLTYSFRFFQKETAPRLAFLKDPMWTRTYEIVSPVSGLHLAMRKEETVRFTYGLQYQWESEPLLPIVLVPNDEPPPDTHNFYVYDAIAQLLSDRFNRLPIRDQNKTSPERLRDWLNRNGDKDRAEFYGYLRKLGERTADDFRSYEIREISDADTELIQNIQNLRTKNHDLRQKLVHLAQKYGEEVRIVHEPTESTAIKGVTMTQNASHRRFRIALSFSGDERSYVGEVADHLSRHFGTGAVFYDQNYRAELARVNLDTYLQRIYYEDSDIVALFFSDSYNNKMWCGLEWRAIRNLIAKRANHIIPIRMSSANPPEGLFPVDGYLPAYDLQPSQVAEDIITRYSHEFSDVKPSLTTEKVQSTQSADVEFARLETYLYISETKLHMLFSQIPLKTIADLSDELRLDPSVVKDLANETLNARAKYSAIKIVEKYLLTLGKTGNVDQPDEYFKGELDIRWGEYDKPWDTPSPLVYFGGETPDTIVGLGGSSHHVIGSAGVSHPHSHSATPYLVARLKKELQLAAEETEDYSGYDPMADRGEKYTIAMAVDLATSQMSGPSERVKFVARKLAFFPKGTHEAWRKDMNILLGSPLYVCSASI